MSNPNARKGRHAATGRSTGRRLATAAAALAAGAVPLATAGSALAATAPQSDLQTLGLPNVALPLGLPDSIDPLTAGVPVVQDLPLNTTVSSLMPPLGQITQVGNLGLLPVQGPAANGLVRSAGLQTEPDAAQQAQAVDNGALAAVSNRALTDGATRTAGRLTSALPVANLVPQLASTAGGPMQLVPNVFSEGALGTLAGGVAPQASDLTGGIVGQTGPLVAQLHQTGVPTVGDLTTQLSGTQLPVVGTVGSLTGTLPVTTVLGNSSPVTGTLQNLSGL